MLLVEDKDVDEEGVGDNEPVLEADAVMDTEDEVLCEIVGVTDGVSDAPANTMSSTGGDNSVFANGNPNCEDPPVPQHFALHPPLPYNAHVTSEPALATDTPVDTTTLGVNWEPIDSPTPKAPRLPRPKHRMSPLSDTTHVWDAPHALAAITTPVSPVTARGDVRVTVVPSPSCPKSFNPQHNTASDDDTTHVW